MRARKVTVTEPCLDKSRKTLTITKDVVDNFLTLDTGTLKINSFSWNEPFESIVNLRFHANVVDTPNLWRVETLDLHFTAVTALKGKQRKELKEFLPNLAVVRLARGRRLWMVDDGGGLERDASTTFSRGTGTFKITKRILDHVVVDGDLRLRNSDWDDEDLEAIRRLELAADLSECDAARAVKTLDLTKSSVFPFDEEVETTTLAALRASFPNLLRIHFAGGRTIWVADDGGGFNEVDGTLTVTDATLRLVTDGDGIARFDGRQWGTVEDCVKRLKFSFDDVDDDADAVKDERKEAKMSEERRRVKEILVGNTGILGVDEAEKNTMEKTFPNLERIRFGGGERGPERALLIAGDGGGWNVATRTFVVTANVVGRLIDKEGKVKINPSEWNADAANWFVAAANSSVDAAVERFERLEIRFQQKKTSTASTSSSASSLSKETAYASTPSSSRNSRKISTVSDSSSHASSAYQHHHHHHHHLNSNYHHQHAQLVPLAEQVKELDLTATNVRFDDDDDDDDYEETLRLSSTVQHTFPPWTGGYHSSKITFNRVEGKMEGDANTLSLLRKGGNDDSGNVNDNENLRDAIIKAFPRIVKASFKDNREYFFAFDESTGRFELNEFYLAHSVDKFGVVKIAPWGGEKITNVIVNVDGDDDNNRRLLKKVKFIDLEGTGVDSLTPSTKETIHRLWPSIETIISGDGRSVIWATPHAGLDSSTGDFRISQDILQHLVDHDGRLALTRFHPEKIVSVSIDLQRPGFRRSSSASVASLTSSSAADLAAQVTSITLKDTNVPLLSKAEKKTFRRAFPRVAFVTTRGGHLTWIRRDDCGLDEKTGLFILTNDILETVFDGTAQGEEEGIPGSSPSSSSPPSSTGNDDDSVAGGGGGAATTFRLSHWGGKNIEALKFRGNISKEVRKRLAAIDLRGTSIKCLDDKSRSELRKKLNSQTIFLLEDEKDGKEKREELGVSNRSSGIADAFNWRRDTNNPEKKKKSFRKILRF